VTIVKHPDTGILVPADTIKGPCFVLGVLSAHLGTPRRYTMRIKHSQEWFKANRLYAHLGERQAFIVEKVQWGLHGCEYIAAPFDLGDFGMAQEGLELHLPTLDRGDYIAMVINYTGRVMPGFENGAPFSLPIVWAEPGASLLRSANVTQSYSVE